MCTEGFVYDLEVEDNHNYFANGILAHNCGAYPKPAKRVKDLLKFTRNLPIIYLSATPTPESFSQIYHQFFISSFSPFSPYKSFYRWAKDFVTVKKKFLYNREINDYSAADQDKIEQWTNHLFFAQTQQASGFSEVIKEKVLTVPMSQVQKAIHDTLLRDRIVYGQSGAVVLGDSAVKLQNKIHQICSGTIKDEEGKGHIISKIKGEYIKEYFAGKKIVVFYKFIAEFEMLKAVFGEGRWTDVPEVFQQSDDKVFLGQFQSAREGIRLDTADAIVFITPDFSYLSYEQSRNRIMSKERTKEATLYWVFSEGGIENRIYQMVTKKKDFTLRHFKTQYNVRGNVQIENTATA